MSDLQYAYEGQIFIKVKPTDNREDLELVRKDLATQRETLKVYQALLDTRKKEATPKDIDNMDEMKRKILRYKAELKMPEISFSGCDHFWSFSINERNISLTSIPNDPGDMVEIKYFHNLEEIAKEFRSLRDIINYGLFVGRVIDDKRLDIPRSYLLYEYKEGYIYFPLTEDNRPKRVSIGNKEEKLYIRCSKESIPELDNPDYIYKYVSKLKRGI